MIVLITMTGARPDQFELCARWMKSQTYKGKVTWIIVDDAEPRTTDCVTTGFNGWDIRKIYPSPSWVEGQNTQCRNLLAGLEELDRIPDVEACLIIEDDDYYKPQYIAEMVNRMGSYDVIGETHTIYYNVNNRTFVRNNNSYHASLFQVAFHPRVTDLIKESCYIKTHEYIDLRIFQLVKNVGLFRAGDLAIGMKGIAGRGGIGVGHVMQGIDDFHMKKLQTYIGADFRLYEKYYRAKVDQPVKKFNPNTAPLNQGVFANPAPKRNINNSPLYPTIFK